MNAEDVARYLEHNPSFFEKYADLLAQIYVSNPHGGRAIALSDRQVLSLRDKNRALETRLSELIRFGKENDAIGEKVHRLSVALLGASELDGALSGLYGSLRDDFGVPHVAMRLWRGGGPQLEFETVSEEIRDSIQSMEHLFCGPCASPAPHRDFGPVSWFHAAAEHVRSVAFMPLRDSAGPFGLLALGAEDTQRFYPEMGTLYLKRIGELASAVLARVLQA